MPRWTHSGSERASQRASKWVSSSKWKLNCVKWGHSFYSSLCVCAAIAVLIFFLKCTSTFHTAFTCPIQMITSKESSVCFFTLLLFLSSIYSIHSFIHIRYCVPAWTRPFPRFHVINYALSCLAIVVISENKMRFQIRLSTIRRQRQNQINGEK